MQTQQNSYLSLSPVNGFVEFCKWQSQYIRIIKETITCVLCGKDTLYLLKGSDCSFNRMVCRGLRSRSLWGIPNDGEFETENTTATYFCGVGGGLGESVELPAFPPA